MDVEGYPPDLADGLTERQRRVLRALSGQYVRSQRVVAGDPVLYDTLVAMTRPFVNRYPLIEGHGNFGSIDGWPPAEMGYTEARVAPIANDAATFPYLLANGALGWPSHNLRELVSGTLAYLDDPSLDVAGLMYHIPGPDFASGGIVYNTSDLAAVYSQGSGELTLRGRAEIQATARGPRIIISELPFGCRGGTSAVAEGIAHANREGIASVVDLSAESDSERIRLTIDLAEGTDPEAVLEQVYSHTPLQSLLPVHLVARADGTPRLLTLRDAIAQWVELRLQEHSRDAIRRELVAAAEKHGDARRTTITI